MATMTITTTAGDAQRLATAMGSKLNLGRDATAAEIKADTIAYLKAIVSDQERIAAQLLANSQAIVPT